MNHNSFMVCAWCITYNQSIYIQDTLDGFAMQQTSFPFICTIEDDASTDGEQEVLRDYLQEHFDLDDSSVSYQKETDYAFITFARHKTNINCYFAVLFLKENHHGQGKSKMPYLKEWMDGAKYCAICEGDDFWCDPLKLQQQVDFLEAHPEHSLCFHAVNDVFPNGETQRNSRYGVDLIDCPIEDFFKKGGSYSPTCSMLFVKGRLEPEPTFRKMSSVGDSPLILTLFIRGKVGFLNKVMACYRVNAAGSWSQRQKLLSFGQIVEKCRKERAYWNEVNRYTVGIYARYVRKRKFHTWLSLGKSLYYFVCSKLTSIKS